VTEAPVADRSVAHPALERRYFWVLATLLFLFCLRVLGQILVAFLHVSFLPPMEEWMSGLLPYPELLTAQILIIVLYGKICLDFSRGHGFFVTPRRRLGTGLLIFGSLYLGVMILRYVIRMSLYPHERCAGGCIPIFFHWVLSSFILVLGSYHWRTTQRSGKPGIGRRLFQGVGAVAALLCISAWATHHSERDAFWTDIDGQNRAHSLKAPALLMAGWYDSFLPTQLNDFMHIRLSAEPGVADRSRLVIGPWTHASEVTFPDGTTGENFRRESLALSLPWFDENSGLAASPPASSPIRLFVMGKNEWRSEQEWPLARTQYVPYFLSSGGEANSAAGNGTLNAKAPTTQEPADLYTYDPLHPVPTAGGAMIGEAAGIARQNDIEARKDVLVYTTPSLNRDVEVTGPISLILYVATTATSADFTAKLVDVHRDGSAFNISEGILRRSYQEAQRPSAAEKVHEIHLELWPTSMVFFKGHRIRLEVSSSNFPRFDRNPNTGNRIASEVNVIPAKQTVRHGLEYPSRLILPIIPAGHD
jgi:hypothetical protein